jgi:hypothetical protein
MRCPFPEKRRYREEGQALATAVRRTRWAEKALRAYVCPSGGHWHLTSQVGLLPDRPKPKGMKRSVWAKRGA